MRFREGSQSFHRRYLIFEPLGAGGMAAVYRAKDRLGGYVALKRLVTDATRLAARSAVASPVETTAYVPDDDAGAAPRAEGPGTVSLDGAGQMTREVIETLSSTELPVFSAHDLPATIAPDTMEPLVPSSTDTREVPSSRPSAGAPPSRISTSGVSSTLTLEAGPLARALVAPASSPGIQAAHPAPAVDTLVRPLARPQGKPRAPAADDPFAESGMRLKLALAAEFQTLSSVRHPNVISVLDYGFDESGQPYFTMELLERAMTILEAGTGLLLAQKISLLEQVLQALLYLHRRRVIHRDIKPGNVLVVDGRVKVVDFGVAVKAQTEIDHGRSIAGTPAYMAPELFHGKPATEASDLYAFGVLAYELLTGRNLFSTKDVWAAVADALYKVPDLSALDPRIAPVVGKLLAKDPTQRYSDAAEVIAALGAASGQALRVETAATRESCLQAARLVGRDEELTLFTRVLEQVLDGRGSAWLVGGESGVGKSRLLDELRARALVAGAAVLRGQEVSEGGAPYQVFGDVLRWLVLLADPRDEEASILKSVVPDMQSILGRDVPDAPEVSPEAFPARLSSTVEDLLRRLRQPALILLEDLHWSRSDSIKLLARITAVTAEMPVLIVASYRDDERRDLPDLLPAMQAIKLERLTPLGIAALTESMIGPAGSRPEVVERLILETEGNPFFLVEVVRTLAERAGQLDRIAEAPLSGGVSSQGVELIVARRLGRVPKDARPLLEAAAVAGRRIDLKLMQAIDADMRVDDWLAVCTGAAALDVQDGRLRFAHDKLREGLLAELSAERRRVLHQQIAAAIEAVYPGNPDHTASLAHHWAAAGDAEKAARYAGLAGEQALQSSAYEEAAEFFKQALSLLPDEPDEQPAAFAVPPLFGWDPTPVIRTIRSLGTILTRDRAVEKGRSSLLRAGWEGQLSEAYSRLGNGADGLKHGKRALQLLGVPMPQSPVTSALGIGGEALQLGLRSVAPAAFVAREPETKEILAEAARIQARVTETSFYAQESLAIFLSGLRALNLGESAGAPPELAGMYMWMGLVMDVIPLHFLADRWCDRAKDIAERQCKPYELGYVLQRNAAHQISAARWTQAEQQLTRTIAIAQRSGDQRQLGESSALLSMVRLYQGRPAEADRIAAEALALARRRGDSQAVFWSAAIQATSSIRRGGPDRIALLSESLPWVMSSGMNAEVIFAKGVLALAHFHRGDLHDARQRAEEALVMIREKRPVGFWTYPGVAGVAEVLLSLWEAEGEGLPLPPPRSPLKKLAADACKGMRVFGQIFPYGRPAAWLWKGLFEQLCGRTGRAQRAFDKAIAEAEQRGMPYERARAHFELGRHARGHDRTRNLMRAAEFFAEADARPELRKAELLIERGG